MAFVAIVAIVGVETNGSGTNGECYVRVLMSEMNDWNNIFGF